MFNNGFKILTVAVALCFGSMLGGSIAATQTSNIDATVTVNEVFSISIDNASVDFGSVVPGSWAESPSPSGYTNAIVFKSNTGNPVYLNIRASGPLSMGSDTIPLASFTWLSTYAGSKNAPYIDLSSGLAHPPAGGYQPFTLADNLVYTSGSSDYVNLPEGTEIQFKYGVSVSNDPSPPTGVYSTTVYYTMTE